jgi:acetyltransferase-like isoleucine patch superfamily enzyme
MNDNMLILPKLLKFSIPAIRSDVNWIKTLYYNLRYANRSCPLRIYPKVHIHISPSAKIIIHKGGLLRLGCRWNVEKFKQTELIIRENAILEIHDLFLMFTGSSMIIEPGAKVTLGGRSGTNHNARITAFNSITIGDNVYISENVILRDSDNHPIGDSSKKFAAPITIGNSVLIGINATILKGVTIGDGAVVAANSLVNRSVPSKTLVGGVPAKVLRENIVWKP